MKTERKIKVCHVLTDTNIGGAGTALVNLLTACDRERFAFSVVLPYGSAAAPLVEKTGADIFFAHGIADRSAAPAAIPALTRIFRRLRPDIVHTHASLSARLAARAAAVPVIIMTRHCADPLPRVFSAAGGILLRGCCTRAIAVGDDAADALAACGFPRERIDVILNGTAPLREPTEAELDAAREKLGINKDDFTVGIFARLEKRKAHEVFLEAARLCTEKAPDIRFLVVGDGSRRTELEEMSRRMGLAERVRFCSFCPDIAPLMALCAANVNTSVPGEVSSLAITEGLSLGVPPVVSRCRGSELLTDGCGIVTTPGSAESTADAVMRLYSDRGLQKELSAAARLRYAEHFTACEYAQRTEAVYLHALADNSPHRADLGS
mgnify:FL=1